MSEETKKKKRDVEKSRAKIIEIAKAEFASNSFHGARVDAIAEKASCNKQLLYYYFKNKDNLFCECLKDAYVNLRRQEGLINLDKLTAYEAILKLVEANWKYYQNSPELIFLLISENLLDAIHLKEHQEEFCDLNKEWLSFTEKIIEKGRMDKTIRSDLDAMNLNITIAALVIFSISNVKSLSVLYKKNLSSDYHKRRRLDVIKDTISRLIKP